MGIVQKIMAMWMYAAAITFLAVTGGICIAGVIDISGNIGNSVHLPLATFAQRAEFTFRFLTLGLVSFLGMIFYVIFQRVTQGAINPLAGQEDKVQKQANILQNTFEQLVLSALAQLCLISFIGEKYTLRIIPWVNFCFILGRIAFVIGYPNKRSFGIFLSLFPSVGMTGVCFYKLMEHLFTDDVYTRD